MQQGRTFRVVKRRQAAHAENGAARAATVTDGARGSEREMRAVVSGWVREHREGAEELRRAAVLLLAGARPGAATTA